MDRRAWLEERRTGIGSSDSPNLLGVGFRDAAAVYRSKVEAVGDSDPEGVLELGLHLEPLVAAKYARAMGVELVPSPPCKHARSAFLMSSPDYRRVDGGGVVELKTTAGFGDAWGEPGTDEIPDGYRVQVTHQMGVSAAESIDLAALCRITGELRVYRVGFDAALWAVIERAATEFWHEHVQKRQPPGPEWDARFNADAALPPKPGTVRHLGPDVAELLRVRKAVAAVRDEADGEYQRLTARVTALLGDAERGECPGWKLKRVFVKGGEVKYDRKPYYRLDARPSKESA